jgi:hypothetical protein
MTFSLYTILQTVEDARAAGLELGGSMEVPRNDPDVLSLIHLVIAVPKTYYEGRPRLPGCHGRVMIVDRHRDCQRELIIDGRPVLKVQFGCDGGIRHIALYSRRQAEERRVERRTAQRERQRRYDAAREAAAQDLASRRWPGRLCDGQEGGTILRDGVLVSLPGVVRRANELLAGGERIVQSDDKTLAESVAWWCLGNPELRLCRV